jgi:hypothetical protein
MRNEEPTRTDSPRGFTGDLAADVGASLSRGSELAEGFADARLVLLVDEGEFTTAARALSSQAAQGHVELRHLSGRPC